MFIFKKIITGFLILMALSTPTFAEDSTACDYISGVYDSSPIQRQLDTLCKKRLNYLTETSSSDEGQKKAVFVLMIDRQMEVAESYLNLSKRVNQINIKSGRKSAARDALKSAEKEVESFIALKVESSPDLLSDDPYRASDNFNQKEKAVQRQLIEVNRAIISPSRPGVSKDANNKEVGGVPEGDLIDDFVPGVIRLLFRFTTLVIFISFMVSGFIYITAFGNDDSLAKARKILYYSLVGFAILTLAFAIVQAITDIDFFGFI